MNRLETGSVTFLPGAPAHTGRDHRRDGDGAPCNCPSIGIRAVSPCRSAVFLSSYFKLVE